MADPNFFPGFEGDDEPKKPAAKPAPAPAPAKPAFDPFADNPVAPKSAQAAAPAAAPAPPKSAPAAAKPATGRVGKAPAPAAAPPPPPPPSSDADADIKPGSRKDLWKCPHCGTGNKPDRTTCRACGKSPDEPVVLPWYKNNLIRAGLLAVIGLIIIGVVMLTRVDLSLREPELANVDRKAARIAGSAQGSIDLGGGLRFEAVSQISVCGRVAAIGQGPGGTVLVALALGPAASEEKPAATPANGTFEVEGVVLACSSEGSFAPKAGQILSLVGATGVLVKDGRMVNEPVGIIPVSVQEHRSK